MNIYRSEDIKKAVPLIRYFTDQNVPLSSGNRRAVATWRGGTHPSVSIDLDKQLWNDHVTGEGGSGGALAIAVGDRIFMLENAVYSVISPEGCAGILWRDGAKAPEAAAALKITAADLKRLGAIDAIISEPAGGAQKNHKAAALAVKKAVLAALKELAKIPVDQLVDARYAKFRAMGNFYK